jgi:hypothetical protein
MNVQDAHDIAIAIFPGAQVSVSDDLTGRVTGFRLEFDRNTIEVLKAMGGLVATWHQTRDLNQAEPFTPLGMSKSTIPVRVENDRILVAQLDTLVGWLSFIRTQFTDSARKTLAKELDPRRIGGMGSTGPAAPSMRAVFFLLKITGLTPRQIAKSLKGFKVPWQRGSEGRQSFNIGGRGDGRDAIVPSGLGLRPTPAGYEGRVKFKLFRNGMLKDSSVDLSYDHRFTFAHSANDTPEHVDRMGVDHYLEAVITVLERILDEYARIKQAIAVKALEAELRNDNGAKSVIV